MFSFTPPRDRDAWNIIRGYVYQVDLTIERWLGLQPGEILELERGEDIDLVTRSLVANTEEEQQRLLEQVKHRDQSVTLQEPSAVEAVACAIEHSNANPGLNLFFRYTTNARIGTERSSPMPNRTPAISIWEEIRQRKLSEAERDIALEGIRTILANVRRPGNLPDDTWRTFQTFIADASNNEFLEFIYGFVWSTNVSSAQELGPHIQRLLINQRYAKDSQQAEEQYQRLFLYVFKLLTQPDIKRLTVEDRELQLSLPLLGQPDSELLDNVISQICRLEARVDVVEFGLSQLNSQVQRLAQEKGIDAAIEYTVATPILDLPPLVEHLSRREKTVNTLKAVLADYTWLAVHGSAGSGKTQLIVLLAQALGNCRAWVRLRDLTIKQASLHDETVARILTTTEDVQSRELLYRLSLIMGDFSIEDVQAIAATNPIIERPRERLHNLIGLWVQHDTNARLLLSPLGGSIGSHDLSPDTRKACHLVLGDRIVREGKIDLLDGLKAIVHFATAEAFDQAGLLLISFYNEMYKLDNPIEDRGLLSLWSDLPLPKQMDLGIRLCLRGLQVGVLHKLNRNITFLVEDLDLLIEQASENEAWAVLIVLVNANPAIAQNDLRRANHFYLTSLRLLPYTYLRKPDGGELAIPDGMCQVR